MPRALWKGAVTFGLVYIPVELHSAEKRHGLDLTMLDRRDMNPVGYQRINKETGKAVPWDDVVKGYEYEKERYVVLSEADFRKANVEATQTANITSFVQTADIPLYYYDTPCGRHRSHVAAEGQHRQDEGEGQWGRKGTSPHAPRTPTPAHQGRAGHAQRRRA